MSEESTCCPWMSGDDLTAAGCAALAVTAELMVAGALEAGSPWAPINAVAPLVLSPEAAEQRDWDDCITPVGLGITLTGLAAWAYLHHRIVAVTMPNASPAVRAGVAVVSAAKLAAFDYRVLPPARRPQFSRWISSAAIVAKYGVFAAALALCRSTKRAAADAAALE